VGRNPFWYGKGSEVEGHASPRKTYALERQSISNVAHEESTLSETLIRDIRM